MTQALSQAQIDELLKTPTPRRGGGGTKVDQTEVREINVWFKLNHHLCGPDCEHRAKSPTEDHAACWNPNCVDTRDKTKDRGTSIVVLVKDQYICRYCFLSGYLKNPDVLEDSNAT